MHKKIIVYGTGYVGLSNAILLAQHNYVVAVDINAEKVNKINLKKSPIKDPEIIDFLKNKKLNLIAKLDAKEELTQADFVVVATPTDYNENLRFFDTSSVETVISEVRRCNQLVPIVIKSTIPLGYVSRLRHKGFNNIFFVPEFLREGRALYDNLHPSRIIVGDESPSAKEFASLLLEGASNKKVPILYTGPTEAEAVKLFANSYLAMRVSFFNELDTYALTNCLKSEDIIRGVSLDPRIGDFYNNPSFGYGGYCLPKDTKQLLANYKDVPQTLITAIVKANGIRKDFISQVVLKRNPKTVGIFRLTMKSGSDNFRASAIFDICRVLKRNNIKLIAFEPSLKVDQYDYINIVNDLSLFTKQSDLILANRYDSILDAYKEKVITRDIFNDN